jgi:hypothetical protein
MPDDIKEASLEWPQTRRIQPCTYNACLNGHQWQATLALGECPGCKAPVLVGLMENCPICNEPTAQLVLRADHVMKGGGISAQCLGQMNFAEVLQVTMKREHYCQAEANSQDPAIEHAIRMKTLATGVPPKEVK